MAGTDMNDSYDRWAQVMKAMGHPLRLRILEEIDHCDQACVCHLENSLGLRQAYVSQHLARLRSSGLVVDRREGLNVYYSLADESVARVLEAARDASRRLSKRQIKSETLPGNRRPTPCPCPRCRDETAAPAG